jgi:hypothetical protein
MMRTPAGSTDSEGGSGVIKYTVSRRAGPPRQIAIATRRASGDFSRFLRRLSLQPFGQHAGIGRKGNPHLHPGDYGLWFLVHRIPPSLQFQAKCLRGWTEVFGGTRLRNREFRHVPAPETGVYIPSRYLHHPKQYFFIVKR